MTMREAELDWDHLRVFLAVMRASSLRQAAESLGVSHPTIARRLDALEGSLGLQLFDRRSDGLHATPAAAELLATAQEVERSVHALRRRALGADPELRGSLRVTLPDIVATELLMPEIVGFCERHPQIDLALQIGYELADLDSREADVAIRSTRVGNSPAEHLTGRRVATIYRAIYGRPHQWIGWTSAAEDRAWVVLVHPDMRRSPRLRVFRDEMVAAFERLRSRLEGRASPSAEPD